MSICLKLREIQDQLPEAITLVAVSKNNPPQAVQEAYDCGQKDFGENRVQELVAKAAVLPKDIRWHLIGHLQSNKVKQVVSFVHLIHSVDSLKLFQELERQAEKQNKVINVLLQIYIAEEETKFGLDIQEAEVILEYSKKSGCEYVNIKGVMGMASNTPDKQRVEREFRTLRGHFEDLKARYVDVLRWQPQFVSMGMSSDWRIALDCGSNMIRVGSSIFGSRA